MSACKYCDAPIAWNRVEGNWKPTNADGSPHLCSDKRRLPDVNHKVGKLIVGARYRPVQHDPSCNVPPWEECPCQKAAA